jgi:hypothetical protein
LTVFVNVETPGLFGWFLPSQEGDAFSRTSALPAAKNARENPEASIVINKDLVRLLKPFRKSPFPNAARRSRLGAKLWLPI